MARRSGGRSQPVPPIWRITRCPCARRALPGRMITLNTSWKTSCSWLGRLAADARQGEPGLLRLDEDEWVTLADSDDLGALADQGGHELQGMPGQGAARATRDGGGDGLGAFVVRAGAAVGFPSQRGHIALREVGDG